MFVGTNVSVAFTTHFLDVQGVVLEPGDLRLELRRTRSKLDELLVKLATLVSEHGNANRSAVAQYECVDQSCQNKKKEEALDGLADSGLVLIKFSKKRRNATRAGYYWRRRIRLASPNSLSYFGAPAFSRDAFFGSPISHRQNLRLKKRKNVASGIVCDRAKLFIDTKQFVVLGNAFAPAQAACLDLAGVRRDGEIGDRDVFGLA